MKYADTCHQKFSLEQMEKKPRESLIQVHLEMAVKTKTGNMTDVVLRLASNGYSLFTIETLPTITHLPNNERLGEVSRQWKKLSEDKKEAYNLKAEEVKLLTCRCLSKCQYSKA